MREFDPFSSKKVRRIGTLLFYLLLLSLLFFEFFMEKHPLLPFERYAFFAAFGFVSCVFVIYGAKLLRYFLKRKEDYYGK
ncbi:MAG: hypothetical protein ACK4WB_03145 [Desulfatiglandales bacterium]